MAIELRRRRAAGVLILVAGMAAMLAALAMAFFARMRSDADEAETVPRLAQVRIMLHAAMSYVQESSRLGWDRKMPGVEADHEETWGWIDTRDGSIGPRRDDHSPVWSAALVEDSDGVGGADRPAWPAPGAVVRCPMHAWTRPPWAIRQTMCYNPIPADPAVAGFGMPSLRNPDPLPSLPDAVASASMAVRFAAWKKGDPMPVVESVGLGWFRIYRETGIETDRPAVAGAVGGTFIVTVGAGATLGFKDWNEVVAASQQARFENSQQRFESLAGQELRQWFRIEWRGWVGRATSWFRRSSRNDPQPYASDYEQNPPNGSRLAYNYGNYSPAEPRNLGGTISYIQRLPGPPQAW